MNDYVMVTLGTHCFFFVQKIRNAFMFLGDSRKERANNRDAK